MERNWQPARHFNIHICILTYHDCKGTIGSRSCCRDIDTEDLVVNLDPDDDPEKQIYIDGTIHWDIDAGEWVQDECQGRIETHEKNASAIEISSAGTENPGDSDTPDKICDQHPNNKDSQSEQNQTQPSLELRLTIGEIIQ